MFINQYIPFTVLALYRRLYVLYVTLDFDQIKMDI